MPRVAHFRTPFLSPTETFIHQALRRMEGGGLAPAVFTKRSLNRDSFPVSDLVDYSARRLVSAAWWLDAVYGRLAGKEDVFLLRELRRRGVRLLHAHFGPEGWQLLGLKRRAGLPLVTTFYGYDVSKLPLQSGWRERYAELFREGELFLVEGPHMKARLADLGCPADKIRVHHIALDLDRVPFLERPAAGKGPAVFLFCGRFTEKKGLIYALKAFKRLLDAGRTDFEFRVIGDGPLRKECEGFAAEGGLESRVRFLGMRSHEEFYGELARSDVFVSPSVTAADGDTEGGAPTTILEAQAAGLPVAATLHADIPEVVVPGKSARLSPERDDRALAEDLAFLMDNRALWGPMGRAGRDHVEAGHEIGRETRKLEAIYADVVRAGRGNR